MNETKKILALAEASKENYYIYGLQDRREIADIPELYRARHNPGRFGVIGAYQGTLTTALYRRYENLKRQLHLFTPSAGNMWLRNCLNEKAFPQVRLLFVCEGVAKHTLRNLLSRVEAGEFIAGAPDALAKYIRQPTVAETMAAEPDAQSYSDTFFAKLWGQRELCPSLKEVGGAAPVRTKTPGKVRLTIAGLSAQLEVLTAKLAELNATVDTHGSASKQMWDDIQALKQGTSPVYTQQLDTEPKTQTDGVI